MVIFILRMFLLMKGRTLVLDWRQNFGEKNYEYGDVYYDLAKFMHGLVVDHNKVQQGRFSVVFNSEGAFLDIESDFTKVIVQHKFNEWLDENNYSSSLVSLHTALIFVNISGLHDYPYAEFLFLLGQFLLQTEVNKRNKFLN